MARRKEGPVKFRQRLFREVRDLSVRHIRAYMATHGISTILTRALRGKIELDTGSIVFSTGYHWAIFYHDGRQGFSSRGKVLIWFQNPRDDPRNKIPFTRYPKTKAARRVLTRSQYEEGLRRNRDNYEAGLEPYMIVRRSVGPADGHPFLTESTGLQGLAAKTEKLILDRMQDFVLGRLPPSKKVT